MKKLFLLLFTAFFFNVTMQGQSAPDDGKKLGLVAYLTYVKAMSEAKMTSLATDSNYAKSPAKAKKFNADYNLLKLAADKLIYQLSVDLYASNRLKLYKSLDQFLKTGEALPSKFNHYKPLIEEIDGRLESFLIRTYSSALAGPSLEEIMGGLTLAHTIITDARDFREKKIQSVTGLLKELHLAPLTDLVKPKEKEEEEKKA